MDERIRQAEARVEQKLSLEEKDLFDRRQKLLADMEGIRLRELELNSQRELLDRSATLINFIWLCINVWTWRQNTLALYTSNRERKIIEEKGTQMEEIIKRRENAMNQLEQDYDSKAKAEVER